MPCGDKCCQRIHFFEKKLFSVLNVRTLITQKSPRAVSPKGTPAGSPRAKKQLRSRGSAGAFAGAGALGNLRGAGALRSAGRLGSAGRRRGAGSEALVLAGSDTDVLDGAVEAGALEEEESVPQATRDSAISAATARTRTFFIVKTSIFSILYTASLPAPQSAAQGHL